MATPALGFAFDEQLGAIRPMRGIPGAALLADPIDAGFPISSAAISPRQDFALATAADSPLRLVRLQTSGNDAQPLEGAIASPDRIVFSPAGHAALLFQNSGRLQVITGLPGNPAVQDWTLPPMEAAPAALGISDDGATVLISGGTQDADPVWLLSSDSAPIQLPLPGSIAAVSFRAGSSDFLAVSGAGDVYLVRNPGVNGVYRMLHGGDGQTSQPLAVRFSSDRSRAYTVNAAGSLSVIDLDSGAAAAISCGCRAAALEPLSFRDLFRVTPVSSSPIMLFDAASPDPHVWFVPPAVRDIEGGVQ